MDSPKERSVRRRRRSRRKRTAPAVPKDYSGLRRLLKRGLIAAAALALGFAGYHFATLRSPEEHFARAELFRAAGQHHAALIELKNAVLARPDWAEARRLLAQSHIALRNGPAALKEIAQVRALGGTGQDLEFAELRAMLLEEQFEEVLARLAFARADEGDPTVYLLRGHARLGLRRLDRARDAFEKALEVSPGRAEAHRGLARVAMARDDLDEAERHIDAALAVSETDFAAWMLRGELRLKRYDAFGAEAAYLKAHELEVDQLRARLALAGALIAQRDPQKADVHISGIVRDYPNHPAAQYLIALMARQQHELDRAERALRDILSRLPDHPPTLLFMASVKHQQGDFRQAEEHLTQYIARRPGESSATKLLAQIYLTEGRPDGAIAVLGQAVAAAPKDEELLAMLGGAYLRTKEYAKASELLARAVSLAPETAAIHAQLGAIHIVTGEVDQGIEHLRNAIGIDPADQRADFLLAMAYFGKGDYAAARATADELLHKQPDNAIALNVIAATYEKEGDPDQAAQFYTKAMDIDPANATSMYNLARLSWKAGDMETACERFHHVMLRHPDNLPVLMALSQIAIDEQRLDEAAALLEQARQVHPQGLNLRLVLIEVHARQGRLSEALEIAHEAAGLAGDKPLVLLALGRAQLAAGRAEEAVVTLRNLVNRAPDAPAAQFAFAEANSSAGHASSARAALEKVLELDPGHVRAKTSLGLLALRAGDPDGALAHARDLQRDHPKLAAGYALEGDTLLGRSQPLKAVALYEIALKRVRNSALTLKLVTAYRLAGDDTKADDLLREWMVQHPDDVDARIVRAAAYSQVGNLGAAIKDYEIALDRQPEKGVALNNLAWLYYRQGDARALRTAQRAYMQMPEHEQALDTYGWLLVENELVPKGIALLERAVGKAPDDPQLRYHFVGALARDGQRERAREELETLLRSDRDFPDRGVAQTLLEDLQ